MARRAGTTPDTSPVSPLKRVEPDMVAADQAQNAERISRGSLPMPAKKATARTMSAGHKAALAEGREQGRAVRAYLEALDANQPRRGRKRTPESIHKRLEAIDGSLQQVDPLKRVQLLQERLDLTDELDKLTDVTDISELEKGFVGAAGAFSERKGISYAAWREAGVPAAVLKDAGISRSS
jgi:hypothetical protein